jgi:hypothetical protein
MCVCIVRTSKQHLFFIALFINYVQVLCFFLSFFASTPLQFVSLFTGFSLRLFISFSSFPFFSFLVCLIMSLHFTVLICIISLSTFILHSFSCFSSLSFLSAAFRSVFSYFLFVPFLCSFLYFFVSFCSCPHGVSEQCVQTCQQVDRHSGQCVSLDDTLDRVMHDCDGD